MPLSIGMRADYQGESAGVGSMDCVPVQFTGKGDAANLQNGTVCQLAVVSGQLSGEGVGGRLVGGDDLGAVEAGGTDLGGGGGRAIPAVGGTARRVPETGRMERGLYWRIARFRIRRSLLRSGIVMAAAGTDPPWPPLLNGGKLGSNIPAGKSPLPPVQCFDSPAGDTRQTASDFVPLTLAGQRPATNVQNEIVVAEPSAGLGEGVIEDLDAGEQGGSETECEEDVSGDQPRASLPEAGCVVPPRAREPVSKRERRRRKRDMRRKREMARKEFERRRGVIPNEPNVSVGEILDSVQGLLPNAVAFLRKYGPRSP